MPVFKVVRGPGGKRDVSQVATAEEEDARLAERGHEPDPLQELDIANRVDDSRVRIEGNLIRPEDPSPAYRALQWDLLKKPISWCERFIPKLTSLEEVEGIRQKEVAHPKYEGGRAGVLKALNTKADELDPHKTPAPVDEAEEEDVQEVEAEAEAESEEEEVEEAEAEDDSETFSCPHCSFKADSPEELEDHVFAKHDL